MLAFSVTWEAEAGGPRDPGQPRQPGETWPSNNTSRVRLQTSATGIKPRKQGNEAEWRVKGIIEAEGRRVHDRSSEE